MCNFVPEYKAAHEADHWQKNRTVLIVDDHKIVREGMRYVIANVLPGMRVDILEAASLTKAREVIESCKGGIDLISLDICLPDADGSDVLNCVRGEWASLPIVVISACEDWGMAAEFLKAGALGFIPKSGSAGVMINAFRLICDGERYFPPQVFYLFAKESAVAPAIDDNHVVHMSPQQKMVLKLILQGRSNKEIAMELGVAVGTAKNYVATVLRAYNTNSRAKAISAAMRIDSK